MNVSLPELAAVIFSSSVTVIISPTLLALLSDAKSPPPPLYTAPSKVLLGSMLVKSG